MKRIRHRSKLYKRYARKRLKKLKEYETWWLKESYHLQPLSKRERMRVNNISAPLEEGKKK